VDAGGLEHDRVEGIRRRGDDAGAGALSSGKRNTAGKIVSQELPQSLDPLRPDLEHEHPVDDPGTQ
jgi:hypothetical protein